MNTDFFQKTFATLIAFTFLSPFVSPYTITNGFTHIKRAYAADDAQSMNELFEFALGAANNEIRIQQKNIKIWKQNNRKGKIKQGQERIKALQDQIRAGNFDATILVAAKKLYDAEQAKQNETASWEQQAMTKIQQIENKAKDTTTAQIGVQNYMNQIKKQIKSLQYIAYKTEQQKKALRQINIQLSVVESYYNYNYLALRLQELQTKFNKLNDQAMAAKKTKVGKTLSNTLEYLEEQMKNLRPQIRDAQLKLNQIKAIKSGATQEELYKQGLTDIQIKSTIGVMQSNNRASRAQDQFIAQNKPQYDGGVVGQAVAGALTNKAKIDEAQRKEALTRSTTNKEITTVNSTLNSTNDSSVAFEAQELFEETIKPVDDEASSGQEIIKEEKPQITNKENTKEITEKDEQISILFFLPKTNEGMLSDAKFKEIIDGIKWDDETMVSALRSAANNATSEREKYMQLTTMPDWEAIKNAIATERNMDDTLQFIFKGKYTDKVTIEGVGIVVILGITGFDAPLDIRDLTHDIQNWEWSIKHLGETGLDGIGFLPVFGVVKNIKHIDKFEDLKKLQKPESVVETTDEWIEIKLVDTVKDPKLKNIINNNYRPESTIGDGSTSDAIIKEFRILEPTKNKWHMESGENSINAYTNWLKDNPNADPSDIEIAIKELEKLEKAYNPDQMGKHWPEFQ